MKKPIKCTQLKNRSYLESIKFYLDVMNNNLNNLLNEEMHFSK